MVRRYLHFVVLLAEDGCLLPYSRVFGCITSILAAMGHLLLHSYPFLYHYLLQCFLFTH